MTTRIVAPSPRPGAPFLGLWHVGPSPTLDAALRAACPDAAIVAADVRDLQPDLDGMRALAPDATGAAIVGGWSAGVQSVRALRRAGARIAGAVTIDGTSANHPPQPWQIDVWRELAAEARAGRCMWVATATQQVYTEELRDDPSTEQIERPFLATVHVLERAFGRALPPGTEVHEGHLHAYSVQSARIDRGAHERQLHEWLPRLLAKHVAPFLASQAPNVEAAALGICAAILAEAQADFAAGVREATTNSGREVDRYLADVGVSPPANWCAAAVTAWIRRAARSIGRPVPTIGSAGAKALMGQLRDAGTWHDASRLRSGAVVARPGWIVVWHRGAPGAWTGHIGIVERVEAGVLHTIEGNSGPSGDRVARMARRLDDVNLLGAGWVA